MSKMRVDSQNLKDFGAFTLVVFVSVVIPYISIPWNANVSRVLYLNIGMFGLPIAFLLNIQDKFFIECAKFSVSGIEIESAVMLGAAFTMIRYIIIFWIYRKIRNAYIRQP